MFIAFLWPVIPPIQLSDIQIPLEPSQLVIVMVRAAPVAIVIAPNRIATAMKLVW